MNAGWSGPLKVHPSTFGPTRDAWDIDAADGTRIAIVTNQRDLAFIVMALDRASALEVAS